MIQSRIKRTYRVISGDYHRMGRYVGGIYPDVLIDDEFFRKLGACEDAPELEGLTASGFIEGARFEFTDFDFDKVREVRETALRYFQVIDGCDLESDLDSVLDLVNKLHSCPESHTKGELKPGELILAMWMADIPFQHFPEGGDSIVFAVDWDTIRDPWLYVDENHGYENLLRPSPWAKRTDDYPSICKFVDLVGNITDKVELYLETKHAYATVPDIFINAKHFEVELEKHTLHPEWEGFPVDYFTYHDEDGDEMPCVDAIEEFAARHYAPAQ